MDKGTSSISTGTVAKCPEPHCAKVWKHLGFHHMKILLCWSILMKLSQILIVTRIRRQAHAWKHAMLFQHRHLLV